MALDTETARLFIACKQAGISLGRLLMLGRQNYLLRPAETLALFNSFGLKPDTRLLTVPGSGNPPFSEPFFECLGATTCDSMDVSAYEGATIIHDSNEPVSAVLHDKFDVVFDGGTLEHVFHFPQALHNAMHMVKPGGWYFGFTPGNNWFGHGFYQFSPEVYYRALSKPNGFSKCAVFVVPEGFGLKWYLVTDPARLKTRTNLINGLRTPLLVLAQKTGSTPPKLRLQQSDYQAFWEQDAPVLNTGKTRQDAGLVQSLKQTLYRHLPIFTRRLATFEARPWCPEYSIRKQQVFQPVENRALVSLIKNLPDSV
jgi:hypothetical protein